MDQRLKALAQKKESLSSVLFVQDGEREERVSRLLSWACLIEGQDLSESKGTVVYLNPKDESLQESIKVDDVRGLLSKLSLKLWDSEVKRYVLIPFSENLTASSSNALLKILEEPPEDTIFLLMASSRTQILETVLSRSLIVNMPALKAPRVDIYENAFYKAFFKNDKAALSSLKKDETQRLWTKFYEESLEFVRLDKVKNKASFFETLEGVGKRLSVHMDNKWIASYISRNYTEV